MKKTPLHKALEQGFDLVFDEEFQWPELFDDERKIILLEGWLEFFEEQEEYDKCSSIKELIEKLEQNEDSK